MAKILIVEDNQETQALLQHLLKPHYEVDTVSNLAAARESIARNSFDVIILDRSLPDGDGVRLCAEIQESRETSRFSILMLTAHGTSEDKIEGLTVGADDYLVKPFVPGELLARVEALLRRQKMHSGFEPVMTLSNLVINFELHTAYIQKSPSERLTLDLTPIEFKILSTLAKNFGKELDRQNLARAVWEKTNLSARNIDTHVCHIRKKISPSSVVIKNRRGTGYYMEARTLDSATQSLSPLHLPKPESEPENALYRITN